MAESRFIDDPAEDLRVGDRIRVAMRVEGEMKAVQGTIRAPLYEEDEGEPCVVWEHDHTSFWYPPTDYRRSDLTCMQVLLLERGGDGNGE